MQLIVSTNLDNYITLNSYQPLISHRSYVKMRARLAPIWHRGLFRVLPLPRALRVF